MAGVRSAARVAAVGRERARVGVPTGVVRLAGVGLLAGVGALASALPVAAQTAVPSTVSAPAGAATLSASDASAIDRLAGILAADVAADSVGSIAAAVFIGDEIVWTGAFGWADLGDRRLATPATIYRAGSISKSITGLVMMRLVQDGIVGLDQPVSDHLPEIRRLANLPASPRPITYRQLASHTAGLAREPGLEYAARGPFMEWKRKLVAVIPATQVLAAPGEEYRYSNIGYGLLGLALERAAGRPFEVLVDSLVFKPLGMASSSLVVSRRDRRRLATGYVNLPGDTADPRVPRAEHRGRGYKVPNGGVYSTAGDLARFAMAMTGARGELVVADSLRHAMLTDQTPDDGRAGYGFGFQLSDLGTTTVAGHSGSVAGYTAYLAFDDAADVGVVLLRNYNRGGTNLGATAVDLVLEMIENRKSKIENR